MRAFRRGERVEAGGGTCAEALARPGVDRGPGGDVPTGCGHPQFPFKKQRRHLQRAAGIETTSFCLCRNLALPPDARGFGTFSVFLIKFFHAPACFVFTRRPVGSVFLQKKFFCGLTASRAGARRPAPPGRLSKIFGFGFGRTHFLTSVLSLLTAPFRLVARRMTVNKGVIGHVILLGGRAHGHHAWSGGGAHGTLRDA